MAEAIAERENKPETAPQASLMENLESIGQGIKDSWEGTSAAVIETGHSVQSAVGTMAGELEDAVEGAAASVAGTVRGATHAVGRALDLSAHTRRHPWLLVGCAVVLGVLLGRRVGPRA